jgi:hypothetical protein
LPGCDNVPFEGLPFEEAAFEDQVFGAGSEGVFAAVVPEPAGAAAVALAATLCC